MLEMLQTHLLSMHTLPQFRLIDPEILRDELDFLDPHKIVDLKYDGFRQTARFDGRHCRIESETGTRQFNALEAEVRDLLRVDNLILDGEVISMNKHGRQIRTQLPKWGQIVFVAFDILYLNGEDMRFKPLKERKRILDECLKLKVDKGSLRRALSASGQKVQTLLEQVVALNLEGVVVKDASTPYDPPHTKWWKVLNPNYPPNAHRFKKKPK